LAREPALTIRSALPLHCPVALYFDLFVKKGKALSKPQKRECPMTGTRVKISTE
jgi:hypothetical protein